MSEVWNIIIDYDTAMKKTMRGFDDLSRNTDRAFNNLVAGVNRAAVVPQVGERGLLNRVFTGASAGLFARGMRGSIGRSPKITKTDIRKWVPDGRAVYGKLDVDIPRINRPPSRSLREGVGGVSVVTPRGIFPSTRTGMSSERIDRTRRYYEGNRQRIEPTVVPERVSNRPPIRQRLERKRRRELLTARDMASRTTVSVEQVRSTLTTLERQGLAEKVDNMFTFYNDLTKGSR